MAQIGTHLSEDFTSRIKSLAQGFNMPDIYKRLEAGEDIEQTLGVNIHNWSELRARREHELLQYAGTNLPHSTFVPTGTAIPANNGQPDGIAFSLRPNVRPVAKVLKNSKSHKTGGGRTYTSKFRGVHQTFPTRRWEAQFRRNGKPTSLGCFDHEEEAARAYDKMMIWCEMHNAAGVKGGITNFDPTEYEKDIQWLQKVTQDELVAILRSDGRRQAAQRLMKQKKDTPHVGPPQPQAQQQQQQQQQQMMALLAQQQMVAMQQHMAMQQHAVEGLEGSQPFCENPHAETQSGAAPSNPGTAAGTGNVSEQSQG